MIKSWFDQIRNMEFIRDYINDETHKDLVQNFIIYGWIMAIHCYIISHTHTHTHTHDLIGWGSYVSGKTYTRAWCNGLLENRLTQRKPKHIYTRNRHETT